MKLFTAILGVMAPISLALPAADVSVLDEREAEAQGVICINCIDIGSCSDQSRPEGCVGVSYLPYVFSLALVDIGSRRTTVMLPSATKRPVLPTVSSVPAVMEMERIARTPRTTGHSLRAD